MNPIANNQTKPNQTQTTPLGAGGVTRSRVYVTPTDDLPPAAERQKAIREYVARILPGEHLGLAVSAALTIRLSGEEPTAEAILRRLDATGRSSAQLRAKGWLK